jgi:hypothetical protein
MTQENTNQYCQYETSNNIKEEAGVEDKEGMNFTQRFFPKIQNKVLVRPCAGLQYNCRRNSEWRFY